MIVKVVENLQHVSVGDLLILEKDREDPTPPYWTVLPGGRYCYRIATQPGQQLHPLPTVALTGHRDDGDTGVIPFPDESPRSEHDPGECNVCDPIRAWWGAWMDDKDGEE